METRHARRRYAVDMLGQGKNNTGGEAARNLRWEVLDRLARIGTGLSSAQKNDWKWFKMAWDERCRANTKRTGVVSLRSGHKRSWTNAAGDSLMHSLCSCTAKRGVVSILCRNCFAPGALIRRTENHFSLVHASSTRRSCGCPAPQLRPSCEGASTRSRGEGLLLQHHE